MKIILTGSLGHISKPLAQTLTDQGHAVTIISSKREKQQDIEALGSSAAIGELGDPGFLTAAFQGADAVYLMVPPNLSVPDPRAYYTSIGNSYVQAVRDSGVKRVVHLSSIGADLDAGTGFILGSHDVEQLLNAIPRIAVTHLRPGYFFYNLYNFAGMIKGAGMIGANYGGDDKIVLAHHEDIAAAAAQELAAHSSPGNTVRYIVSDDRKASEIAEIIGGAIGKPDLQWLTFTDEQARQGMEDQGLPKHIAEVFVEMGASVHSGILRKDYDLKASGPEGKVKLEDFVKEFAAGF